MNQDPLEYSDYLDLMPGYRAGTLSPVDAHRVARLLDEDPIFRKEAERDALLAQAVSELPVDPMPRDLVRTSVMKAMGEEATVQWLSLDSILLALGVGVGGAAVAHFLRERFDIFGVVGDWVGASLGLGLSSGFEMALGVVVLSLIGAFGVVGVLAYRMIRSDE